MSRTIEAIMRHMAPPPSRVTDQGNRVNKLEKEITVRKRHYIWAESRFVRTMTQFNFNFQQQMAQIQSALANTTGNWDAIKKSPAVLYSVLQQQSSLLSYAYGFRFCVLVCLVCAGLAFLFKKVGKATGPIAAH